MALTRTSSTRWFRETINQYIGRIDYSFNPQNQFYGIYIDHRLNETETLPFTGATLPGFGDMDTENIQQITADYVHQFGPTLVNDLAAHYTRFNYQAVIPQTPAAPSSVGFDISPENTAGEGLPAITVSGLNGVNFELGFSTNGPQPRIDQALQLDDSVSKVIGRHALKFGYEGERFNVSNPFSARNNGAFGFDDTSSPFTSGDGSLDFLLGVPDTYGQGSGATIQADAFLNYIFAQDTWKMSDSLTLDYGLAYSIDTPLRNHQYGGEGIACFNNGFNSTLFGGAPTDIAYPGEGGCVILAKHRPSTTSLGRGWDLRGLPTRAGSPAARGSSPSAAASASTTTAPRKSRLCRRWRRLPLV